MAENDIVQNGLGHSQIVVNTGVDVEASTSDRMVLKFYTINTGQQLSTSDIWIIRSKTKKTITNSRKKLILT